MDGFHTQRACLRGVQDYSEVHQGMINPGPHAPAVANKRALNSQVRK